MNDLPSYQSLLFSLMTSHQPRTCGWERPTQQVKQLAKICYLKVTLPWNKLLSMPGRSFWNAPFFRRKRSSFRSHTFLCDAFCSRLIRRRRSSKISNNISSSCASILVESEYTNVIFQVQTSSRYFNG